MTKADWANVIYGYFFVIAGTLTGLGILARHYVQRQTEELKDDFFAK